ncbi:hypothetical protein JL720_10627 [Aureococcus anophagefferens]|nr:hypothetical protein JL720_10627 [Aureococcus anophagefferens]
MDNAAFAKIMATPKPHAGGGGGDKEKPMDKAAIRKLVNADLQREKSKKHKGKGGGGGGADAEKRDALNKWEKKKKDKEKKDGKYRDRAEERRTDTNKDYENQVAAIVDMDAETSRYLGGDVEHTHLVKGLDYALLQKTDDGDDDDDFDAARRRATAVGRRPTPAGGNRRERRKAKAKTGGVVHRDPIMGTATVAAPKLSRNFDGTDGGYGEATLYDSDDETYAMTKKREAAADHEAAAYRSKKKKTAGSDDETAVIRRRPDSPRASRATTIKTSD